MQVITEDHGMNLKTVKVEMLGTAKKVCSISCAML